MSETLPDDWLEGRIKSLYASERGEPLPPTAEQTSIARFNALADQVREFRGYMGETFNDIQSEWIQMRVTLDFTNRRLLAIEKAIKPRAVAKKKAAPLVGKRRRKA